MDAAVKFPTSPKAVKAAPLKLSRRASAEQAFEAILQNCLEQIQSNDAGVARYHDPESLHQMRVGLRRLDAAFSLFGELIAVPPAIEKELAWLSSQLGPARDWDVLLQSTLPRATHAMPGQPALEALRERVLEQAQVHAALASEAVASPRFGKFVNALEHWITQRGWRDDLTGKGRMRLKMRATDVADAILQQEQQRLFKRGRKLREADPARRHRLRIAVKRARYAAEFFAALYPGKQVRPYVQALSSLQDELGWLNDAAVAQRLLDGAQDGSEHLDAGKALLQGYLAASEEQGARLVHRMWKKFTPSIP